MPLMPRLDLNLQSLNPHICNAHWMELHQGLFNCNAQTLNGVQNNYTEVFLRQSRSGLGKQVPIATPISNPSLSSFQYSFPKLLFYECNTKQPKSPLQRFIEKLGMKEANGPYIFPRLLLLLIILIWFMVSNIFLVYMALTDNF